MIYKAELINKEWLTDDIFRLVLRVESSAFCFAAGQFILVQAEINGRLIKRAYSISSTPADLPELELTVRRVPDGLMSNYLAGLAVGSGLEFTGPLGHFSVKTNKLSKVVLVANGCGIAPLKSMLSQWSQLKPDLQVSLFFGNSLIKQIPYHKWFEELAQNWSGFSYRPCVSRERGAKVETGRVTEVLPARYQDFADSEFYISGSAGLIQDTRQLLIDLGAKAENIFQENVVPDDVKS